jgi:hypothetical protein
METSMSESPESLESTVVMVSARLREWIHEVNNALFITKGFLEEVSGEVEEKTYLQDAFDHENFLDMLHTVNRSVERIDLNLQKLRKFAKEEIFDESGVKRPS